MFKRRQVRKFEHSSHRQPKHRRALKYSRLLFVLVVLLGLGLLIKSEFFKSPTNTALASETNSNSTKSNAVKAPASPTVAAATAAPNPCASNTLDKLVLVSISQRHLWACTANQVSYNSPVITGMAFLAADLTPTGTYHIYSKVTDTHLIGHDSTGSWDDAVDYWMPFLDNQYGAYGFHDATWRPDNAFGNISPNSPNASHGCVECPLATAAWLYGWAPVGTTVTIES